MASPEARNNNNFHGTGGPGSAVSLLPPGSWDSHVHVFDPARFPFKPNRAYTPQPAPLASLMAASYAQNIMIVQASIEASPEGLLAHLAEAKSQSYHPGQRRALLRGTMAADPDPESPWHLEKLADGYFREMHAAGVRCIRIHGSYGGSGSELDWVLSQLRAAVASYGVRELGWAVAAQLPVKTWVALKPHVDSIVADDEQKKVVLIADHNASATPKDLGTPEFAAFLEMLAAGQLNVKIGALHRRAAGGDLRTMDNVVKELARAAPEGIVWGSDWPHVNASRAGLEPGPPLEGVDTAAELGLLREWLTEKQWLGMNVRNPARLFAW
ncbi:uncharacterized protein B0I36DRAFT_251008 [Microdochium trichocladiopsis]|uniref:Amidohydrolase-related domain-containing protein n=1 Tax=Microdochium trichocladiopsis TaxID=1682393 RepID=A0A9P8XWJ6_9PEZI|nr:uncharacterized protein B0I36DRAFT_251008 [Microdochium trichocladiopsis]KAH7024554.1 hypothetical protein B0I36DRAFT_251008 [Microdochium trichocladiopsis]